MSNSYMPYLMKLTKKCDMTVILYVNIDVKRSVRTSGMESLWMNISVRTPPTPPTPPTPMDSNGKHFYSSS